MLQLYKIKALMLHFYSRTRASDERDQLGEIISKFDITIVSILQVRQSGCISDRLWKE